MTHSSLTTTAQLEALARDTFERLGDAKDLDVRFGEETISDLLLLEIKRQKNHRCVVCQTLPSKEKTSGTDWEWWIGSSEIGWVRYAVQAKRADKHKGRYKSLTHTVQGNRQVDLLESYAAKTDAVPLYCFYNYPYEDVSGDQWRCCSGSFDRTQLACTVAPISEVKAAISGHGCKNFRWMHGRPGVVPWRCLAACPKIRSRQREAFELDRPYFPHPLAEDDARIFRILPDDVAKAREQLSDRADSLIGQEYADDADRYPYPRRVLILETTPDEQVGRDV